ncbi:unnamed protein product, partial [Ectocarpus sp. 12 AP-2014]
PFVCARCRFSPSVWRSGGELSHATNGLDSGTLARLRYGALRAAAATASVCVLFFKERWCHSSGWKCENAAEVVVVLVRG